MTHFNFSAASSILLLLFSTTGFLFVWSAHQRRWSPWWIFCSTAAVQGLGFLPFSFNLQQVLICVRKLVLFLSHGIKGSSFLGPHLIKNKILLLAHSYSEKYEIKLGSDKELYPSRALFTGPSKIIKILQCPYGLIQRKR
jgi:hypothetical protein